MLASPNGRGPKACDRNHGGDPGQPAHADGGRSVRRAAGKPANRQADCGEHSVGGEDHGED